MVSRLQRAEGVWVNSRPSRTGSLQPLEPCRAGVRGRLYTHHAKLGSPGSPYCLFKCFFKKEKKSPLLTPNQYAWSKSGGAGGAGSRYGPRSPVVPAPTLGMSGWLCSAVRYGIGLVPICNCSLQQCHSLGPRDSSSQWIYPFSIQHCNGHLHQPQGRKPRAQQQHVVQTTGHCLKSLLPFT